MRAPPHRRRRPERVLLRRPALAVVAVLVWLLGVELGPGLHIARHARLGHHHHGADEALACESHGHQAPAHHHAAEHHAAEHHAAERHAAEHHAAEHHAAERHAAEHHAAERHAAEHHAAERHAARDHHVAERHARHHAASERHAADHDAHHLAAPIGHHEHPATGQHHAHDAVAEPREHRDARPGPGALALSDAAVDPHGRSTAAHEHGSVPHGEGSLAHRDLVPLTPLPVLPPILSAPWQPLVVATHVRIAPRDRTPEALRARGPPREALVREPSCV